MSRFSNPKTIMRFLKDSDSLAYIPTPMGTQEISSSKQATMKLVKRRLN